MNSLKGCLICFLMLVGGFFYSVEAGGDVDYERIRSAPLSEPQNWLTYNGGYSSQRHSLLDQINIENVKDLELKWVVQNQVYGAWQSNPLVVDGIMYLTQRSNDVMAVDAVTGRVFWMFKHTPHPDTPR